MDKFTYENNANLNRLLISGEMEKKIQGIVRNVLKKARARISNDTKAYTGKDLRQAYRAVKTSVYKAILGGNVSILNKRRGNVKMRYIEPPRTLRNGQRGGNRIKQSQQTKDRMSYYGSDRGFVLRFLNNGTSNRTTRFGNRGAIAPRNWFAQIGQKEMEAAMQELSQLIDEEIQKAGIK